MAMPPTTPIKVGEKQLTYFQFLALNVKDYLYEYGIILDFSGLQDTLKKYENMEEDNLEYIWELLKELNAWTDYFSSLANLVQKIYLDSETEKLEIQAIVSIREDPKKVANGDRLANKDAEVVKIRKKRNALKAFYDELVNKVEFLNRAYYHCKITYEINKNILINEKNIN